MQQSPKPETIGLYRGSAYSYLLRHSNTTGPAQVTTAYGRTGWTPVVGDWDGNGSSTLGVFVPEASEFGAPGQSLFFISNGINSSQADYAVVFGLPGDKPLAGDWDGNGSVTVGVFRPSNSTFYLRNTNTAGPADITIQYGQSGDIPVVGDWDGNGTDTVGVYRGYTFLLRNSNTAGAPEISTAYGNTGWIPVVGDWDGNGTTTLGVVVPNATQFGAPGQSLWFISNSVTSSYAEFNVIYGLPGDIPVAGDWDGAPPPARDAVFVSQTVPTSMTTGQTYNVSVRMRNTGSNTWTAAETYRLGSQNPQDNSTWGMGRVELPSTIPTRSEVVFSFTVTAPATPGTYNFRWQMVQDGVAWFGGYSTNVAVTVSNQAPSVAITSPASNAAFTSGDNIVIAASAFDPDGSIGKVEFFWGAMKLGEDYSAPYEFAWNSIATGSYTVSARATDNLGSATTSDSISFTASEPSTSATNHSLMLDGAGSYVEVPNSGTLNITGPLTVEAWIKTNNSALTQGIIERFGAADGGYALRLQGGKLYFGVFRNGPADSDYVLGNTSITESRWYHVAGVYDGAEYRVYLNGKLDGSKAAAVLIGGGAGSLKIGSKGDDASDTFNGLIDEVRVTSGVLYSGDFTTGSLLVRGSTLSSSNDGPRGVWLFDDRTARDYSSNGNNGILRGGAAFAAETFSINHENWIQAASQQRNVSIDFDTIGNAVVILDFKVSDQYPDARFSAINSLEGPQFFTYATSLPVTYGASGKRLTRITQTGIDLGRTNVDDGRWRNFRVDFPQPASNIKFDAIGLHLFGGSSCGPAAVVRVFEQGKQPRDLNLCGHPTFNNDYNKPVTYDLNKNDVKDATALVFHTIIDPDGLDFDNFQFTVPAPPAEVNSVEFETINSTIDNQPSESIFNCGTVCGKRIFPDKQSPTDTTNRARVRVKAVTTYPANTRIFFRAFDLDDPSTNDTRVDPNGLGAGDNKGPNQTGTLIATSALTDGSGIARVEFETTKQPGDNFMLAASADQAYLNGLTENSIGLRDSAGNSLPTLQAKASPMLTVWRKLHVEVDSMGLVTGNQVTGNTLNTHRTPVSVGDPPSTLLTVNLDRVIGNAPGDASVSDPSSNRYNQTSRFIANGQWFEVEDHQGFPKSNVKIRTPNQEDPHHTSFALVDDDDFNHNDGWNLKGDQGENITPPDLTKLQMSADPVSNVFAPAYVLPVYDIGDNNDFVPFVLNTDNTTDAGLTSTYDFDEQANHEDNDFWIVYILGAYQPHALEDADPSGGPGTFGVSDNFHQGCSIFWEMFTEVELTNTFNPALTAAHEVGHIFGGAHTDQGLMADDGDPTRYVSFSPVTLNKIRSIDNP